LKATSLHAEKCFLKAPFRKSEGTLAPFFLANEWADALMRFFCAVYQVPRIYPIAGKVGISYT
jgi:hypothetical protein